MTAPVVDAIESLPVGRKVRRAARPGLLRIWLSTLTIWFFPETSGRLWVDVSLPRAGIIAFFNSLFGLLWGLITIIGYHLWSANTPAQPQRWTNAAKAASNMLLAWKEFFHNLGLIDKCALIAGCGIVLISAFVLPFFVLLPFAARPGRNKACVRHVARTILLSTGIVHIAGLLFVVLFVQLMEHPRSSFATSISPLLLAVMGIGCWLLSAAIAAARVDYRNAADLPQPHDPWCDECGYDLIAADAAGRCPECGRAVSESIGPDVRKETAWEQRPSLLNLRVIVAQLRALVRHPRKLFFSMPSLTGQRAAQRWLSGSACVIALFAMPIVPAVVALSTHLYWSMDVLTGALMMGCVWGVLAIMMVGIETAGIATFSRMRGLNGGVYLAAAAKVTCYSSILMVPWVIFGGVQLVAVVYFFIDSTHIPHGVTMRAQQILLASSLAIAHIGGLLWYELTVYRGIRGIQYANK